MKERMSNMEEKKKWSTRKKALVSVLSIIGAVLLAVIIYLAYVLFSYSRIEDNQVLEINNVGLEESIRLDNVYTIVTQNIGFGAYSSDFTFFMDGGEESRAESERTVRENVNKAVNKLKEYNPDFVLFQEVDFDSTRSHHVDERAIITQRFEEFSSAFAVNYDSAYLMYPLTEPHGENNSGMMTLSKYKLTSSVRRSIPVSDSLLKFLDLDRCYTVTRLPVENGKELVIYNVHMSAYGSDESIRTAQMTQLFNDMMAEYEKGNYCVAGGDFNHDFTGTSNKRLNGVETSEYDWAQPFPEELLPKEIIRPEYGAVELIPTCRNCDVPYEEGNPVYIVDGFLVTDNIIVKKMQNINTGFEYSDHNPVVLSFYLNSLV